jgi:hypothetical protein
VDAPGETWAGVNAALCKGVRGLPFGGSLAQMLTERRGVHNFKGLPRLRVGLLLRWADAHKARCGAWPREKSRLVAYAPGREMVRVNAALRVGLRGLPGGSSLHKLLVARRGAARWCTRVGLVHVTP